MSRTLNARPLKYQKIEAALREHLATLGAGARLPSERELSDAFACSVVTVRKGLSILVEEGVITRRTGSGTFVAPPAVTARTELPVRVEAGGTRVGMLIYSGSDVYAHKVLQAVARVAEAEGLELSSVWVQSYGDEALRQAESLAAAGCTALTLPWFPLDRQDEVAQFIRACPLPVSVAVLIPGLEANCFERPDVFGTGTLNSTEALCEYFRALGHDRIAFLGPDSPGNPILQRMLSAYSCYVSREGLEHSCGLVQGTAADVDALARRWQAYRGHLAVLAYDDSHALRLVTAMHKLGLAAPVDFAVVGTNDNEAGRFCDPPLTTLRQSLDYTGEWLLRNALALARGECRQSAGIPPNQLLVRSSCGGLGRLDEALRAAMAARSVVLVENESELVAPRVAEPLLAG